MIFQKHRLVAIGITTVGVLGTLGAVTIPASAYPPGTSMTVQATTTSGPTPTTVAVNVAQVKPGCDVTVFGRSGSSTSFKRVSSSAAGTASTTLSFPSVVGKIRIFAKTVNCDSSESAWTSVDVSNPRIFGPAAVKAGKSFSVNVFRFPANATVAFTFAKGSATVTKTAMTDANGFAKVFLSLPSTGNWALIAASGGTSASSSIRVFR